MNVSIAIACTCKTVTSTGLFLFKSFDGRGVKNQLAESGDYAKMFNGKYWGSLKIMSNENQKITLWTSSVSLFWWPVAPSQHEVRIKKI